MSKDLVTVNVDLQQIVLTKMLPFKEQIEKWKAEAETIIVTDASQTDLIKKSAVARKTLTTIRTSIEKARKELKSDSLNYGRFIDKIAGDITDEVTPLEQHYRANEEFVEREELKKQEALKAERMVIINEKGISEFEIGFNLGTATDKQFEDFIAFKEFEAKKKLEDEEKAKKEQEEIAKEREIRQRMDSRTIQVMQLGFFACDELPNDYKHKSIEAEFGYADMLNDTEEEWNQKIADVKEEIAEAERELAKEAEEKNKLIRKRTEELQPYIVFIRDYNGMLNLPEDEYQIELDTIIEANAQNEKHLKEEKEKQDKETARLLEEKLKKEAKEKEEQDKKEAAEKLTQGSDKEKCKAFFTAMSGLKFPELRSAKGKTMMTTLQNIHNEMLKSLERFIDSK